MLDTTRLTTAVDSFADRLRAAPQSRLQRSAAAEALELARGLSAWAQRLEAERLAGARGAAVEEAEPRVMPEAGMFAVADQITVAAHDLAVVLEETGQVDRAVAMVEEAQRRAAV
ncbi:hypothetical protein [Streptomyces tsukubensis]|uniref:Uncharacterized protein n=1 Tax=Streptomyces tsukubensis TaxID=83656 RepID=A0A1V4A1B4_9ACTN|nr:hypothetical protein [Streptomyces tsukubensis]OON73014.1 hypothetical protein B1H18_28065 [Streptomyces tsukubensis]QFR93997.1 hypothetical protein GBW32_14165 [Streptomyces tsukubensis]